jgi:uncharacterized repeat protein (TIGR02543 family)
MVLLLTLIVPYNSAFAQGTSLLTITVYASDHTTILDQVTIDYETMEAYLPVQGDGITHQYLQGPVFEGDIWDPGETVNIKDWGANKGTDLKDLCGLVGGMLPGDTLEIVSSDSLARTYDYPNVYDPDPRQGKMVICWWYNGQYVPEWSDGMRLVFFAETTNPDGLYVFGNWDQHECFTSERWYFYNGEYPTTTGHSIKYVNQINIYTGQLAGHELTISVNGSGNTIPSAGVHSYADGAEVTITATPDSGWQFVNWTGDSVTDPDASTTTVTMDEDKTITANFSQTAINYELTIDIDGEGITSPSAGSHTYSAGTVVNLRAEPDDGWVFTGWDGSVADEDDASTTITMDDDKFVIANFGQDEYRLTVKVVGEGTTSPTPGKHYYTSGEDISIEASPEGGWYFINWEGDVEDEDSERTTVTLDENKTVTAHFAKAVCELAINTNGQGSTMPAVGKHRYSEDTEVTLKATPDAGWIFSGWTGDVADTASEETTITMDKDKQITALFKEAPGQVAAVPASPGEGVDSKALPPAAKSEKINWVLALGIIYGEVVLAGIALLVVSLIRR